MPSETTTSEVACAAPTIGSIAGLLASAVEHQRAGRLDAAASVYDLILAADPDHLDARHLRGVVAHQCRQFAVAVAHMQRALERAPDQAILHNNIAEAYRGLGQFEPAIEHLRRAISLNAAYAEAHGNLGTLLHRLGREDDARAHLDRANELRPGYGYAYDTRGDEHRRAGRFDDAIDCYERALALEPGLAGARFMLDIVRGRGGSTAPPAYVTELFDAYADSFDAHLTSLGYRTPAVLRAAVERVLGREAGDPPAGAWQIVDLGCGTGLCGEAFGDLAGGASGCLVGVDLSEKMLGKARERGVYNELVRDDIVAALAGRAAGSVDCIVAADVFIYVGDVTDTIRACGRALRPGGLLACSIEESGPEVATMELLMTGRFAHAPAWIRKLGAANGLEVLLDEPLALRQQHAEKLPGRVFVLRRMK